MKNSNNRSKNKNKGRRISGSTSKGRPPRELGGLRPAKRLGQNFLTDEDVIAEIVEGSGVTEDSFVIEIGPGTGALTLPLAERAGRLAAVELDERMIEGLRIKTFGMDNVEIIHGDILEIDIAGLIRDNTEPYGLSDVRIVGNLPYYITTPIIMKLLSLETGASAITVMMQKEVGDRIAAEPGSKQSGAITYLVHYYADVTEIVQVGRESFYPVPKVDSVVLRLDLRDAPPVEVIDRDYYFTCIKAGFLHRRKTLLNSLTSLGNTDKDGILRALEAAGIDHSRRAESLSMEEFARLSDKLYTETNTEV